MGRAGELSSEGKPSCCLRAAISCVLPLLFFLKVKSECDVNMNKRAEVYAEMRAEVYAENQIITINDYS